MSFLSGVSGTWNLEHLCVGGALNQGGQTPVFCVTY